MHICLLNLIVTTKPAEGGRGEECFNILNLTCKWLLAECGWIDAHNTVHGPTCTQHQHTLTLSHKYHSCSLRSWKCPPERHPWCSRPRCAVHTSLVCEERCQQGEGASYHQERCLPTCAAGPVYVVVCVCVCVCVCVSEGEM